MTIFIAIVGLGLLVFVHELGHFLACKVTGTRVETFAIGFGPRLFGWERDDSPCPAIDGLQKEAKANVKKTDDAIVDSVILQGCVEVEHHEIGVYENLILGAEAMSRQDAVAVLKRNLESEQSALQKVRAAWISEIE